MRKSLWIPAVFALCLALLTPAAYAVQCYQCDNMRQFCLTEAAADRNDWMIGCDQMYTPYTSAWNSCRAQGNAIYQATVADCEQSYEYCSDGCEGPHIPRDGCPIVIDLGPQGFRFTSIADGVQFDLSADGAPDAISWTEAGSPDGFLALDRNQNGHIDSGAELFGNFTAQPAGTEPHGFLALAVFDVNDDGKISSDDDVFGDLRIWTDSNHNGYSEPAELRELSAVGITAIDLDYRESRRKDRHGNELRYRSRVSLPNGKSTDAVDVFFLWAQ